MFDIDIVPFPDTWENDKDIEKKEKLSLQAISALLDNNPTNHAAIIIEPLIQGAGGMRICRPFFLQKLQTLVQEKKLLLIYDEVMTGFGRTGDWFASIKSNTQPDIICLSKGITGGFLPLAVTAVTEKIFNQFFSDDISKTFFHGHSYTANPLACAAALTSIQLLESNPQSFTSLERLHRENAQKYLKQFLHKNVIYNLRFCGTIMAFDIGCDNNDYFSQIGPVLKQEFLKRDLLIRPLGNTIYLMPPYCVAEEQLDSIYQNIGQILQSL
jgi:adenosylmethionine-8-amino-7-oxononanoate aminotransferase